MSYSMKDHFQLYATYATQLCTHPRTSEIPYVLLEHLELVEAVDSIDRLIMLKK